MVEELPLARVENQPHIHYRKGTLAMFWLQEVVGAEVVDAAMVNLMKSGEFDKIYAKWFQQPIPPRNINLNIPMSDELKKVVANPTDSPDPAVYK